MHLQARAAETSSQQRLAAPSLLLAILWERLNRLILVQLRLARSFAWLNAPSLLHVFEGVGQNICNLLGALRIADVDEDTAAAGRPQLW